MDILALEAKLIKMLDAGIPISEIMCLSPYPELEGDWETHFGTIHCTYSRYLPKEEALWLIRNHRVLLVEVATPSWAGPRARRIRNGPCLSASTVRPI